MDVDRARIDQVLTNLVDNALKYSGKGAPVDVAITDIDTSVEITVADRGIGLDPAATDRLFEAFGRGENADHVAGIGLGLFISKQIVGRHGGRVSADRRTDGPGTVFTVVLPRGAAPW